MRLLRRKTKKTDATGRIELERVIGLTATNASGLATNASTGEVAYIAGCVVVIYNPKTNSQSRFLVANRTPKALSCVAYSYHGGKLVAAGESGHQPAVVIWDSISGQCMIELKTHKIGISCVEFSPNGRHIVSVGVPHDGFLCLWEWRNGVLLSKTRTSTVSSPISSVHYSSDGSFFITAGIKHLRQWTTAPAVRHRPTVAGSSSLEGKPINLGSQKDGSFVSISSSKEPSAQTTNMHPIYVLTNAGVLCLLHLGIAVEKWVDLKVRRGFDLAVSEKYVACACSDGIVRFFVLGTLAYTATLPRPAPYGYHGLTDSSMCTALSVGRVHGINFPDAVACSFISSGDRIAVVYGDHSLYVWDVRDFSKISRCRTFLGHASCVWDVTSVPQFHALRSNAGKENVIGGECFATCSADASIRLWNVGPDKDVSQAVASKSANVYCKDILGVLYTDAKDTLKPSEIDSDSQESAQGFRAISVSCDGKYLASGDRSGNLRVYDLLSFEMVSFQEAHDAEILSLSFSAGLTMRSEQELPLLASGGRDRLVHLYDVNRNFEVIETLDDHSASITGVKFACGGTRLLSCSADKSVVFRHIESNEGGMKTTRYHQEVALRGTIYDMDVHPNEKFVITAEQDKKVNILNLTNGKPVKNIKPETEFGEPIKVRIDPSGTFVICSHSDKCMRLYDFASGELLTHASGHAEVITGMCWLPDCKHLISVSGDSCIFIWKLPPIMSRTMKRKLVSQAEAQPPPRYLKAALKRSHITRLACRTSKTSSVRVSLVDPAQENQAVSMNEEPPSFKFSVSKLPSWAQSKVEEETSEGSKLTAGDKLEENSQSAESRWVERVGNHGYKLATEAGEETPPATIHVSGFGARRRFSVEDSTANQDSTPESSLNSQTDGSPMSSPRDPPRKETQWKTVHTVFFDEMDFVPDGGQGDYGDESARPFGSRVITTTFASCTEEQEDGLVVCLPEYEGPKVGELLLSDAISTPREDGNHDGALDNEKLFGNQTVTGKADVNNSTTSPMDYGNVSTGEDTDGCDENLSPRRDLFSAHFDKLTSAAKANSTTRSSLSARFFARTTKPSQDALLLDDDDITSNSGCLLAAERERLKLQERQDKMASEVQRMRERLVNLGISVCEGTKTDKRTAEDVNNRKGHVNDSNNATEPNDTDKDGAKRHLAEPEDVSCGTTSTIESFPSSPEKSPHKRASSQKISEDVLPLTVCLPRPECEYIAALQDLERAAERATSLLTELQGVPVDGNHVSASAMELATRLTRSYQSVLPEALQKIQSFASQLSTHAIVTDVKPAEAADNGLLSRPSTAASVVPSEVVRSSVDIENLLERYSTRFSENLAHQVLALVQKGLGSETK